MINTETAVKIAVGLGVGTVIAGGIVWMVRHQQNKESKAIPVLMETAEDTKVRKELEDQLQYLLGLLSKQTAKRPLFHSAADALRARTIRQTLECRQPIEHLKEMLEVVKTIYDAAEKRS